MNFKVVAERFFDRYRVQMWDGGSLVVFASYTNQIHARAHAKQIQAALAWTPANATTVKR